MSSLEITLIDVGWGDSILLESSNGGDELCYALIDSNDSPHRQVSLDFLLKRFRSKRIDYASHRHFFEFVMASHGHSDHVIGLRRILEEFGAKRFLYPPSNGTAFCSLLAYVNGSASRDNGKVKQAEPINNTTRPFYLGDTEVRVLWPPVNDGDETKPFDEDEPNNNSIVLDLRLGKVKMLLTGDCLAGNWKSIPLTKTNLRFFKVPHHGAQNSTFDENGETPWLTNIGKKTLLAMSTHVSPHGHPDTDVIDEMERRNLKYFRTDEHYHLTFSTDGTSTAVQWSRE